MEKKPHPYNKRNRISNFLFYLHSSSLLNTYCLKTTQNHWIGVGVGIGEGECTSKKMQKKQGLRYLRVIILLILKPVFIPLLPSYHITNNHKHKQNQQPTHKNMSNMNAGQAHGEAQAKAENAAGAVKDTANQAADKAADAADMSGGQAQQRKEEASGILQQTGEQVANLAQGAYDGVKNTLGVGENQKK